MTDLVAYPNIRAAINHLALAAAMLIAVVLAMRAQIVDLHRLASSDGDPGIGTTAFRMNARVGHAQSGLAIHEDIRGSLRRRADAGVWAILLIVGVFRDMRPVAEAGLRTHRQEE